MSSTAEKICQRSLSKVEQEMGRLLGVDTALTLKSGALLRDKEFVEQLDKDCVAVRLELNCGGEGKGILAVSTKNAIRLAGRSLMIPVAELNQSISNDEYDDEYRYAYAEIVKCFVGTFVQNLEPSTYKCAGIRCRKQEFIAGDNCRGLLSYLRSEHMYFLATVTLTLAGVQQDDILLLLPAFLVVCSDDLEPGQYAEKHTITDDGKQDRGQILPVNNPFDYIGASFATEPFAQLMNRWMIEVDQELTAMFGIQVVLTGTPKLSADGHHLLNRICDKNMLLTEYNVNGLVSGTISFIGFDEDVTHIGSLLGALGGEMTQTAEGLIDSQCEDGYHELCSIILAIGAEWLADKTSDSCIITRERSSLIQRDEAFRIPESKFEDQQYVVVMLKIAKEENHQGYLHILIPSLFAEQLELVLQDFVSENKQKNESSAPDAAVERTSGTDSGRHEYVEPDRRILLVNESENNTKPLRRMLESEKFDYDQVFIASESLQDCLLKEYQSVFLVVEKPDEIALSNVIKINSISATPLVVAAPQWTQSQVVNALRYGAADIMVIPVSGDEFLEKLKGLEPPLFE